MKRKIISILLCVICLLPLTSVFVSASNTNVESTTYYASIPYRQIKYSYVNSNNVVDYTTNWAIEDTFVGNTDNTKNVISILDITTSAAEYVIVNNPSAYDEQVDFDNYVTTDGKSFAMYFYELDVYAVKIWANPNANNGISILSPDGVYQTIYEDWVWSNEKFRNYKIVEYTASGSVSATANVVDFGTMYQAIINDPTITAQTVLGLSWLSSISNVDVNDVLREDMEVTYESIAVNGTSNYAKGYSTLTTYKFNPSSNQRTRLLIQAKNFQVTPDEDLLLHYIETPYPMDVSLEINYTYFIQNSDIGVTSVLYNLTRKTNGLEMNLNYEVVDGKYRYYLLDYENNEAIFDMLSLKPIINNLYIRIGSNGPISEVSINNMYSRSYRSINNALKDMISNVSIDYNNNNEPSSSEKNGLFTWIIRPLDSILSTEIFYGIAIADILWLCVGVALIIAILKIFAGG